VSVLTILALLAANAFLPDPFIHVETGKPIRGQSDWGSQRQAIRAAYERHVFGRIPPAPTNMKATVLSEEILDRVTLRKVLLEFGPEHKAKLHLELILPQGPGPFPVFMTNHPRTRPWAATAVRRGYAACIYQAQDPRYGPIDDSESFKTAYPDYDFSMVARWGWAGMRAVDYLTTIPSIDKTKIAISGHSRNGKQALFAAAFDERISAIALSSGNTGEGTPWRYTTEAFWNESIEQITTNFPEWFHPNLKQFIGREHELPVDQNLLMSMVAPRALLLASAYSEGQGAPFGFEQAYRSVRKVYEWMGQPGRVGLSLRAGEHPTTAGDIENYIDFFDLVFGRRAGKPPETWILGYDYDRWLKRSGESRPQKPATLEWLLGEEPASLPFPVVREAKTASMTSEGWLGVLYQRPLKVNGAVARALPFGDDLKGDLYLPEGRSGRLPVVVWLHPYSHATGYSRYSRPVIEQMVKRGFAVLCFDQIGFGTRVEHSRDFYDRYPHWSLLGKMVADTRAAVRALSALDTVDAARIYLAGFSLGGRVALWTAAFEPSVAGVASLGGLWPMKDKTSGTEGLEHFSHLHGLLPRLGFFVGRESELAAGEEDLPPRISPRPVLVMHGTRDRYAPVARVRLVKGAEIQTPDEWHRLTPRQTEAMVTWLSSKAGLQ
jgi:dienelactone hydrolase